MALGLIERDVLAIFAGLALGRIGKDSEISSLIAYLAGPEASFVTDAAPTMIAAI